jgi:C4-dicarboxylate transporter DctM subunit
MGYVLGGGFIVLLIIGLPIGIALALASILGLGVFTDLPMEIAAQRMAAGVKNFSLLAIPLYILAGTLMNAAGITQRLVDFAYALVGGVRGGMAQVTILTTAIFGGISGSQVADTSSVGRLMIPEMVNRGYDRRYSVAVMGAAGALFVSIPPAIPLIVYGVLAGVSISDLFFYGLLIGVFTIILLMGLAYVLAIVGKQPKGRWLPLRDALVALRRSIWSLLLPVVVLGGIRIGAFTPTEGGAIAVLCAVVIGVLIHRELKWRDVLRSLAESSVLVGVIMLVIAAAQLYAWALVSGQIPQGLASAMLALTDNPLLVLLIINLLLLVIGTVMEANAALIVFVPLLLPIATAVGIDPLHLGLIMVVNLGIGLLTPPVGMCLLVAAKIGKISVSRVLPAMVPWFILSIVLLALVTYVPPLVGWV